MRDYSDHGREAAWERDREQQEAESDAAAELELLKLKAALCDEVYELLADGCDGKLLAWCDKYDELT